MEEFSITWSEKIYGDIKIRAKSSKEAKAKLRSMTKQELVKSSSIWNSDENTKVESVDTYLGVFNEELWDMIFDEVDNEWVLFEKESGT